MRKRNRHRHQFRRFGAGKTDHHPLVAGAGVEFGALHLAVTRLPRTVHAGVDVGRLLVDGGDDPARLGVEANVRGRVADLANRRAHDPGDVDIRRRRDLARHEHETVRDRGLAGDAGELVVRVDRVEHGIRDLVADLVRVPFCHGFRGEEPSFRHVSYPSMNCLRTGAL